MLEWTYVHVEYNNYVGNACISIIIMYTDRVV